MLLDEIKANIKSGDEPLLFNDKEIGYNLIDFWRWSVSDILSNATRGRLAEFIIATATNIDISIAREEWAAYDLITPDGIKIEVKSAAYLQSWFQKAFSIISFSTKPAKHWDSNTNVLSPFAKRHADVYVFCLLKHEDKQSVNPLNMDHWDFFVLSTIQLNNYTRSQHSITLKSLKNLTQAIPYSELNSSIINSSLQSKNTEITS